MFPEVLEQWAQHSGPALWYDNAECTSRVCTEAQFLADVLLEPSIQRPKYKKNSLKNQLLNFFHFYGDSEKEILKSFFKAYHTWKQKAYKKFRHK